MWLLHRHAPAPSRSVRRVGGSASAEPTRTRPIVVGVDGSGAGARALEWATLRATAGRTSLRIVHAAPGKVCLNPFGYVVYWDVLSRETGWDILDAAAQCAREQAPGLVVSTILASTDPSAALIEEDGTAELIVLGRRHSGPSHGRSRLDTRTSSPTRNDLRTGQGRLHGRMRRQRLPAVEG
jgi:nucleotide-binding universal stress UspA family protein